MLLTVLAFLTYLAGKLFVAINHRFFADATTNATDEVIDRVDEVRDTVDRVLHDSSSTQEARTDVIDAIESEDAHVYVDEILGARLIEFDVVVAEQANGSFFTKTTATLQGRVRLTGRVGGRPIGAAGRPALP